MDCRHDVPEVRAGRWPYPSQPEIGFLLKPEHPANFQFKTRQWVQGSDGDLQQLWNHCSLMLTQQKFNATWIVVLRFCFLLFGFGLRGLWLFYLGGDSSQVLVNGYYLKVCRCCCDIRNILCALEETWELLGRDARVESGRVKHKVVEQSGKRGWL
jgi:hypothetical protein